MSTKERRRPRTAKEGLPIAHFHRWADGNLAVCGAAVSYAPAAGKAHQKCVVCLDFVGKGAV